MTARYDIPDADTVAMKASGMLAYLLSEIEALEAQLRQAPNWRPAAVLGAQATWCRAKLAELTASWGRKLVVALAGPSGAGKSTLLNALAGRELSPTGLTRPTTRGVVIYTHTMGDAENLVHHCGSEHVRVETDYDAPALQHLILVDTPDTNTLPENQRLLSRVLERTDVLLAIFPAQNPKLYDNITFLRPFVRQLPPDAVLPILNHIDRVPPDQMEETVADFRQAIAHEWGLDGQTIYRISAKAAMPGASFAPDETPLHALNEMDALRATLFSAINQAGQVVDRRLARAEHVVEVLRQDCARMLAETAAAREQLGPALRALSEHSQQAILEALTTRGGDMGGDNTSSVQLHAYFYAMIGPRWWGPVGWLIGLWALGLRFGVWLGHVFRPERSALRLLSPRAEEQSTAVVGGPEPGIWQRALTQVYVRDWPALAETVEEAGFDASVRQAPFWQDWVGHAGEQLRAAWLSAQGDHLQRLARTLSSWPLQVLLNAMPLGMIGWVAVQTLISFFQGHLLPADYFRHAGIATLAAWLLGFTIFQIVASLPLRRPWHRQMARAADTTSAPLSDPLGQQLAALDTLGALAASGRHRIP